MIQSAIFTKWHVHVSALHPNQTTLEEGIEAEMAAYRYMNEDVIPRTELSTAWRAANAARFPALALEAKCYLSALPTSMASERLFTSEAQV